MKNELCLPSLVFVLLLLLVYIESGTALRVYRNNEYEVSEIDKRLDIPHPGPSPRRHRHGLRRNGIIVIDEKPEQSFFKRHHVTVPEPPFTIHQHNNNVLNRRVITPGLHGHKDGRGYKNGSEVTVRRAHKIENEDKLTKSDVTPGLSTTGASQHENSGHRYHQPIGLKRVKVTHEEKAGHELEFESDVKSLGSLVDKAEREIQYTRSHNADITGKYPHEMNHKGIEGPLLHRGSQHMGVRRQEIIHALNEENSKVEPEDDIESLGRRMDESGNEIKDSKYEQATVGDKHAVAATRYIISKIQEIQDKLFKRTGNKELEDKLNQMATGPTKKDKSVVALSKTPNKTLHTSKTNLTKPMKTAMENQSTTKEKDNDTKSIAQPAERRKIIPEEVVDKILEKFQQLKKEAKHIAVSASRHSVEHAVEDAFPVEHTDGTGMASEYKGIQDDSTSNDVEKYSFTLPLASIQPRGSKISGNIQIPLKIFKHRNEDNNARKAIIGVPILHLKDKYYLVPAFGALNSNSLVDVENQSENITPENTLRSSCSNSCSTFHNIVERLNQNPRPSPIQVLLSRNVENREKEYKQLCMINIPELDKNHRVRNKLLPKWCADQQMDSKNRTTIGRRYTYHGIRRTPVTSDDVSRSLKSDTRSNRNIVTNNRLTRRKRQDKYSNSPSFTPSGAQFNNVNSQVEDALSPETQHLVSSLINTPDLSSAFEELRLAKSKGQLTENPLPDISKTNDATRRTIFDLNIFPRSEDSDYQDKIPLFQENERIDERSRSLQDNEYQTLHDREPKSQDDEYRTLRDREPKSQDNEYQTLHDREPKSQDNEYQTLHDREPKSQDDEYQTFRERKLKNQNNEYQALRRDTRIPESSIEEQNKNKIIGPQESRFDNSMDLLEEQNKKKIIEPQEKKLASIISRYNFQQVPFISPNHQTEENQPPSDGYEQKSPREIHFGMQSLVGRRFPGDVSMLDNAITNPQYSNHDVEHDNFIAQRYHQLGEGHGTMQEDHVAAQAHSFDDRRTNLPQGEIRIDDNSPVDINQLSRRVIPVDNRLGNFQQHSETKDHLYDTHEGNRFSQLDEHEHAREGGSIPNNGLPFAGQRRNTFPKISATIEQVQEETNRLEREYEMLKYNDGTKYDNINSQSLPDVSVRNYAPNSPPASMRTNGNNLLQNKADVGIPDGDTTPDDLRAKQLEEVNRFAGRESLGALATRTPDGVLAMQNVPGQAFKFNTQLFGLDALGLNYGTDSIAAGDVRSHMENELFPGENKLSMKNMFKQRLFNQQVDRNAYKRQLKGSTLGAQLPVGSLAAVSVDRPSLREEPIDIHSDIISAGNMFWKSRNPYNRNKIVYPSQNTTNLNMTSSKIASPNEISPFESISNSTQHKFSNQTSLNMTFPLSSIANLTDNKSSNMTSPKMASSNVTIPLENTSNVAEYKHSNIMSSSMTSSNMTFPFSSISNITSNFQHNITNQRFDETVKELKRIKQFYEEMEGNTTSNTFLRTVHRNSQSSQDKIKRYEDYTSSLLIK